MVQDASGARSFAVDPADLAAAGSHIQGAVAALPAALDRFLQDGYANPAEFGSTAQDHQVGDTYVALCQIVGEMLPMTQDGIYSLGGAVQRWAGVFADQDADHARAIARELAQQRQERAQQHYERAHAHHRERAHEHREHRNAGDGRTRHRRGC